MTQPPSPLPDKAQNRRLPLLIVVTGATASGKTDLAIRLAERFGTEIISADSRQIYRNMPVTTAVPTVEQRARVMHHLVEAIDIDTPYSAAAFEKDSLEILPHLFSRAGCAVVCGGSMLYIDALTRGLDDIPTISDTVRNRVREIYAQSGLEGVAAILQLYDPEYYEQVDKANPRRVMHAIEICMQSGKTFSQLRAAKRTERPFRTLTLAIDRPRQELFGRIDARVLRMVENGMEEEARRLYPFRTLNALNTVGFKEWFAYFDGLMSRETAIARIAKNTRVYAKKQLTWLKRRDDIVWLDGSPASEEKAIGIIATALS
ncbi:MAG: tRNA (adenosine(37)-N6)-dimethylallyltransferase MiaA [Bacteroidales bacterium]|nr:tRNA (adenosine(37)-N6)-dimethylallyltransferase MiaA [Bacteroidales bacterium]